MTYDEAKSQAFAEGTIPALFGDGRIYVCFAWDAKSGNTVCATGNGSLINSNLPPAADQAESLWLLQNHWRARRFRVTAVH